MNQATAAPAQGASASNGLFSRFLPILSKFSVFLLAFSVSQSEASKADKIGQFLLKSL
jgi:hypothetical protein